MPALGTQDVVDARRYCSDNAPVTWTKPQINAAIQAIDQWFDLPATRAAISAAINVATSPKVFTPAEKLQIVRAYLRGKFNVGA